MVRVLRPAVDHLLHLWMPRARVAQDLAPLWDALEERPGFSRQWHNLVQRVRDQLTLHAIPSPPTGRGPWGPDRAPVNRRTPPHAQVRTPIRRVSQRGRAR